MKILQLRFKNLNSLYGEWVIDFSDPEYRCNGIFALTGPTGAGKSTILDAICLALYGATPRLGKITKSSNEIMSRQSGECFSEVLFESQAGTFLCHWAQHRARRKASGELQSPKHEIAEGGSEGRVIESHLRRVAVAIETRTGMDFERFTRSMLLAQGGFDTFLKANMEEKSRVLEQITGTGIYSEISQRVHQRQREERGQLELLQAETRGIEILEPEQEAALHSEIAAEQRAEQQLAAAVTKQRSAIEWLHKVEGLKSEIAALSERSKALHVEREQFNPQYERLHAALRAAELDGAFASLSLVRRQQQEDQRALEVAGVELRVLEQALQQQRKALQAAEEGTRSQKEQLQKALPLIQRVRAMDQRMVEQQRQIGAEQAECGRQAVQIDMALEARGREQLQQDQVAQRLENALEYLEQHAADGWLVSGLAAVEAQLKQLRSREEEVVALELQQSVAEEAFSVANRDLQQQTADYEQERRAHQKASATLQEAKGVLSASLEGRLLREYRAEKEALLRETALITTIHQLQQQRERLEDGEPCPLCGSEQHPFAEGTLPTLDLSEQKIQALSVRIAQIEGEEAQVGKLEQAEQRAKERVVESEKRALNAKHRREIAEKARLDGQQSLQQAERMRDLLQAEVEERLQQGGVQAHSMEGASTLLESLQQRLERWNSRVALKEEAERACVESRGRLEQMAAVIEQQESALKRRREQLRELEQGAYEQLQSRHQLYGEKCTDVEEQRLQQAVVEVERAEKRVRAELEKGQQRHAGAESRVSSLSARIAQGEVALRAHQNGFSTALQRVGLLDEEAYHAHSLPVEVRNELKQQAEALEQREIALQARQMDRENRLKVESEKCVTDQALGELELQQLESEQALKQLRQKVSGLEHRVAENRAAKQRMEEKRSAIEGQRGECERWERLHALIGSADGKRYRNFAQGLTFELMVSHANRQLQKMTERYLLIRSEAQPLELNVIDHYQAGEVRSVKNLSGGESFIVSLALALGLSKMASRKVRVDSLFLDEGFGTLDEESLETALDTLAGLHQDGKLIGVISHVPALKERIGVQIQVSPVANGRSRLLGAGVVGDVGIQSWKNG